MYSGAGVHVNLVNVMLVLTVCAWDEVAFVGGSIYVGGVMWFGCDCVGEHQHCTLM
jgi:hypothetical protein